MPTDNEGRDNGADLPLPETAPAHKAPPINVIAEDDRTITLQYPNGDQRRVSKEWLQAELQNRRPILAQTKGVFVVQELDGTTSVVPKKQELKPAEIYPGEIVAGQTPTHWVIDSNGSQFLQPKRFY
ncbi:hypothetical protein HY387_01080 [Candidatus Daviesbacteria bacterium]|nr:hypothetical protein [Candidatus Daviesbacteria bacterium]